MNIPRKSSYTYKCELEQNLLKEQAVLNAGYNYKFLIFDQMEKLVGEGLNIG